MDVQLVADRGARFPEAEAVQTQEYGWVVALYGDPEDVLPRGAYASGDWKSKPRALTTSVHDAFESLEQVSALDEGQEAANALAEHCRAHPVGWLLCQHGLPVRHVVREHGGGCQLPSTDGTPSVVLTHVHIMMEALSALEELAYRIGKRQPVALRHVSAVLRWAILPDFLARLVEGELDRDGVLNVDRAKQIVTRSLRSLQEDGWTRYLPEWIDGQRIQLVAHVYSDLGFYIAEFTGRVMNAAKISPVDASVTCTHCGMAYQPSRQPKPGSAFCQREDCRRAYNRQKKARSRARLRALGER